ncbi:hypothetical protein TNCV_3626231 [Trichonephila clavipes]|nr:hypothetical protein TNCV_3626231 [Trichonephila clavipes]
MYDSSSSVNPTPLAPADNQRDVHPRGGGDFTNLQLEKVEHLLSGRSFGREKKENSQAYKESSPIHTHNLRRFGSLTVLRVINQIKHISKLRFSFLLLSLIPVFAENELNNFNT